MKMPTKEENAKALKEQKKKSDKIFLTRRKNCPWKIFDGAAEPMARCKPTDDPCRRNFCPLWSWFGKKLFGGI